MMIVNAHFTKYGPRGVPKGRVDVQKLVQGRTPCLSHKYRQHPLLVHGDIFD